MDRDEKQILLDDEEQWYEDHAEEFVPVPDTMREKLIQAAKKTIKKTERMNIRMSKTDMESLKLFAAREGLPYQSLVASILHKYTLGQLIDINEVQKMLK